MCYESQEQKFLRKACCVRWENEFVWNINQMLFRSWSNSGWGESEEKETVQTRLFSQRIVMNKSEKRNREKVAEWTADICEKGQRRNRRIEKKFFREDAFYSLKTFVFLYFIPHNRDSKKSLDKRKCMESVGNVSYNHERSKLLSIINIFSNIRYILHFIHLHIHTAAKKPKYKVFARQRSF